MEDEKTGDVGSTETSSKRQLQGLKRDIFWQGSRKKDGRRKGLPSC
jgi:hypothetical protein